jgi:hypothetical protein
MGPNRATQDSLAATSDSEKVKEPIGQKATGTQTTVEVAPGNLIVRVADRVAEAERGKLSGQIELMIKEIQSLQDGAFAPLSRQPIFRAILMPFGGAGLLALLDYFSTVY